MTAGNERETRGFGIKIAILVVVLFTVPLLLKAGGCLPARVQPGTTAGPAGEKPAAPPAEAGRKNPKGND